MDYYVEFKINSLTRKLELLKIDPPSSYAEQMFYNESLFVNVDLDQYDSGKFRLDVNISEDGYISVNGLEEWIGWVEVDY